MRLIVIDSRTGAEERHNIRGRAVTFDFDSEVRLRPMPSTSALRIEDNGRNVLVTDLGIKVPVRLADVELPPQRPWVWLPSQELRLGPYVLLWQPSPSMIRRWLLGLTADRVARGLTLLTIVAIVGALIAWGVYAWQKQRRELSWATTLATWLPFSAGPLPAKAAATPTPIPTLPAPTPTLPIITTRVTKINPTDIASTGTPTPTATLSMTILASNRGAVPTLTAHMLTPESWDSRLSELDVKIEPARVAIGGQFWWLRAAKWLNEEESNGMHHVFIDVEDEGQTRILNPPVTVNMHWTTGKCTEVIKNEQAFWIDGHSYGANCPMFNGGAVYSVNVDGLPSDVVQNLGLGTVKQRTWAIRTSFLLIFQRATRTK